MTSNIQWEEDWFSVSCDMEKKGDILLESESVKEWNEKDIREQEKQQEQISSVREVEIRMNQRMDWLERLIHHQSEIIQGLGDEMGILTREQSVFKQEIARLNQEHTTEVEALKGDIQALKGDIQALKGDIHSTSHTSMTELLEELKRVKERELNYALRRHQPVPFFDSGNLMRMVGSVGSVGSVASPLFRNQAVRKQSPSFHL